MLIAQFIFNGGRDGTGHTQEERLESWKREISGVNREETQRVETGDWAGQGQSRRAAA